MENKNSIRVKKVLLSVLAIAILALIAVNVNLVKNGAIKANVKLEKLEALGDREYSGSGPCSTHVDYFDNINENEILVTYDCHDGNGYQCVDGFEVWYNSSDGSGLYMCYEYKETTICI